MNSSNKIYTSCLLCGSKTLRNFFGDEHFLVQCKNCLLTFSKIEPDDEELKNFYYDYPSYEELSSVTLKRYNDILDRLETFRNTNNLLETGCGYGYFLEEAKKRNWNVYGTELSVKAIEKCRGKNIYVSDNLNEFEKKSIQFDAIVSLEVIEHLKNPVKEIAEYAKILRPEGALYFTTPNFNSFSRRLLNKKWNVIIYPEHLYYFTVNTLNRLMEGNNFKVLTYQTSGFSPARLIFTMRSNNSHGYANSDYDYNEKDRQVRDSIEKNIFLRYTKNLINGLLTLLKAGDSLKILYIKQAVPQKAPVVNGRPTEFEKITIHHKREEPLLKISVTVPSYNQGKYLEETILSVLEQDYSNLELFVMDGGSNDESLNIINKYKKNLTGWISEKDSGQSDAINKGFKKSTGDIVSWLCSDDLYTPYALKKVHEIFSSLPTSTGVVHGNSEIFKGEQILRYDKGYEKWSIERQLAGMAFPQPSSFIRRSAFEQTGLLNNSLHYGMDYDLFSRLTMICDFHYEDHFFSKYRLHGESKSTIAESKFIEEWILIFNSIVDGLNNEELKNFLVVTKLKIPGDNEIINFYKGIKSVKKFDNKKVLFFFLINVIRYDYASERFARVRKIGSFVKENFGDNLKSEPDINRILNRSNVPSLILLIARKFKRSLSK